LNNSRVTTFFTIRETLTLFTGHYSNQPTIRWDMSSFYNVLLSLEVYINSKII